VKRPPILLSAGVAVLALAASSCGSSGSTGTAAYSVNGHSTPRSTFNGELKTLAANTDFVTALQQQQAKVTGQAANTIDAGFARQVMGFEILMRLAHQEVTAKNLKVDPTVTTVAQQLAAQQFGGDTAWAKYPQTFKDAQVAQISEFLQLRLSFAGHSALDDATLKAVFDKDPTAYAQKCLSHILVATQADANKVADQLKAGADFATLAKSTSTDTGSGAQGGQLRDQTTGGCQSKAQIDSAYVAEFAKAADAATKGVPTAPFQSQYGWHVILVTDVQQPTFDQVKSQVTSDVLSGGTAGLQAWETDSYAKMKLTIDPRYGTWDPKTKAVIAAPAGKTDIALS